MTSLKILSIALLVHPHTPVVSCSQAPSDIIFFCVRQLVIALHPSLSRCPTQFHIHLCHTNSTSHLPYLAMTAAIKLVGGRYIQHVELVWSRCVMRRMLYDMLHHATSLCTQPVTDLTAAGPSALSNVVTSDPASQSANTCHERNTML